MKRDKEAEEETSIFCSDAYLSPLLSTPELTVYIDNT